jgi:hypothetical protein
LKILKGQFGKSLPPQIFAFFPVMNSDRKFKPLTSCSLSQLSLTSCELFKFFFSRFSSPSSPPAQLQLLLLTPYFLPSSVLRQQHQELPIRTVFFSCFAFSSTQRSHAFTWVRPWFIILSSHLLRAEVRPRARSKVSDYHRVRLDP